MKARRHSDSSSSFPTQILRPGSALPLSLQLICQGLGNNWEMGGREEKLAVVVIGKERLQGWSLQRSLGQTSPGCKLGLPKVQSPLLAWRFVVTGRGIVLSKTASSLQKPQTASCSFSPSIRITVQSKSAVSCYEVCLTCCVLFSSIRGIQEMVW